MSGEVPQWFISWYGITGLYASIVGTVLLVRHLSWLVGYIQDRWREWVA